MEDQPIYIVIENNEGVEKLVCATHDHNHALQLVFEESKFDGKIWREVHEYKDNERKSWNMSVSDGIIFVVTQFDEDSGEKEIVYVGDDKKCVDLLESLPEIKDIEYIVEKWSNGKRVK